MTLTVEPVRTWDKDPAEVWKYGISWVPALATGETISTSTWAVPAGITKDSESNSTTVASLVLSGGTAGETYDCVNTITTSLGNTGVRTIRIVCRAR